MILRANDERDNAMVNFKIKTTLRGEELEDFLAELDYDFYIGWNVIDGDTVELSVLEESLGKIIERLAKAI
jgi:hypothetical protein